MRVIHIYIYIYMCVCISKYKSIDLRVEPQAVVVVYPVAKCPVALDAIVAAHVTQWWYRKSCVVIALFCCCRRLSLVVDTCYLV